MVKMSIPGITIEVPEKEVDLYKRAGYKIVVDEPAPVEVVEETNEPAPVKKNKK